MDPGCTRRNSDNRLILKKLGWQPSMNLKDGLENLLLDTSTDL